MKIYDVEIENLKHKISENTVARTKLAIEQEELNKALDKKLIEKAIAEKVFEGILWEPVELNRLVARRNQKATEKLFKMLERDYHCSYAISEGAVLFFSDGDVLFQTKTFEQLKKTIRDFNLKIDLSYAFRKKAQHEKEAKYFESHIIQFSSF